MEITATRMEPCKSSDRMIGTRGSRADTVCVIAVTPLHHREESVAIDGKGGPTVIGVYDLRGHFVTVRPLRAIMEALVIRLLCQPPSQIDNTALPYLFILKNVREERVS